MNDVDDSDHELTDEQRDKLRCLYDVSYGDKRNSYRRRPASEMLYAMIEANGKRTN